METVRPLQAAWPAVGLSSRGNHGTSSPNTLCLSLWTLFLSHLPCMHDYTGVPVLWSQRLFYFQGDKTTSSSVSDCSRISTLWQLSLTMLQEPQLLPHPQMLCLSYSLYSICSGPFLLWKNDSSIKCDFRMFRKGTLMVPFPFFFI